MKIDIKYRTQTINEHQTKLEILIDKQSGDTKKIIAVPVLIVSRDKPAILETVSDKSHLDIRAERVK